MKPTVSPREVFFPSFEKRRRLLDSGKVSKRIISSQGKRAEDRCLLFRVVRDHALIRVLDGFVGLLRVIGNLDPLRAQGAYVPFPQAFLGYSDMLCHLGF
jgi:hypothetical protein